MKLNKILTSFALVAGLLVVFYALNSCNKDVNKSNIIKDLTANQQNETIVLSWTCTEEVDGYYIYKNKQFVADLYSYNTTYVDSYPSEGLNEYKVAAYIEGEIIASSTVSVTYSSGGGGETTGYYIKHPWGTGLNEDWTWEQMTRNGSVYEYVGQWGGVGANINTTPNDNGASWITASDISGSYSVSVGQNVKFTYTPAYSSLSVTSSGGGGGGGVSKPSAPSNVNAMASGSSINVSWSSVSDADSYKVYRSTSSYGTFSYMSEVYYTSYTDNSVTQGQTYYYKVTAVNNAGESSMSSYGYATATSGGGGGSKPSAPTGVSATSYDSYVSVTWSSVSNVDSYKVYRSTSSYGTYSELGSAYNTSYSDYSVTSGKTYYYKVTAVNNVGESSMSSYASVAIAAKEYAPCNPTVKCSGTSSISVSWSPATSSGCGKPTSYDLLRRSPITGSYEELKSGTTSTSYSDTKPFPGINYYGVKAINAQGSAAGTGTSNSVGISAPSVVQVYASWQAIDVTVKDLDVPDNWKQYYKLQAFESTSSSGSYYIWEEWGYNDAIAHDYSKKQMTFEKEYGVDMRGQSYYLKFRWVFQAPNSIPTSVEGTLSSYQKVTH